MRLKKIDKALLVVLAVILLVLTRNVYADLTGTEGYAIDLSSAGAGTDFTIAFDATEIDAITWSDNANASNIWTFNVSGVDHTMTAGNGLMTFGDAVTITDILTTLAGINLGTSQSIIGTTAMTFGNNGQTIAINSSDWDIGATGIATGMGNITSDGTVEGATITEGGNAVYSSGETPSGELGGTYAAITIDDSVTVTGWVLGTSSATQLTSPTLITDLIDTTGAADIDYGSADVTDHTFTTDDCTIILDGGVTVSTGDTITLGATAWNSADNIDGEVIADDTIDDDSIDWADVTGVDMTLTDAGAITSSGTITATTSFIGPLLDAAGDEDMDYGSADVDDHTFIADGGTVVIDGSIQFPDADGTPAAAGELQYDNTVANWDDGAMVWYDDDEAKYLVDLATLPTDDDYVVAYDAAIDKFYMKEDADSGGATAYDDIGNPDAAGSIAFDATETAEYTSAFAANDFMTIKGTGNFGDYSLLTLTQDTGNPTDGDLLDVRTADAEDNVDQLKLGNGTDDYMTVRVLEAGTVTFDIVSDGTAAFVFGSGDETLAINTADWDIDATGVMTGIGDITSDGDITVGGGDIKTGDIALVIGDGATDSITFSTDGTGTAEIALPAGSIDGTEILDDTVDSGDYAAASIDNEHLADNAVDSAELAAGSVDQAHFAVDVIGVDEMADVDHGDVVWSGGAAAVEAILVNDAATTAYYLIMSDSDTGSNSDMYADTELTYTEATGTLAATEFSGGGGSLTGIDAATGDSATAFFDAGTIEHEYGGLQANISGYTGLIAITGADTTAEIDSLDEIEGQLADVTLIYTEAIIPAASADPDVDAAGEFSIDTDGANEPNDVTLRVTDVGGDEQYALAQVIKSIQGTVITPNDLADATRDACPVWENNTGMTFTITMIRMWADTDDTTVNVETYDSDWDNNATVDAIEVATDEVANFSTEETTITAATIVAGSLIVLDFDDTDDPGWVKFNIMGYFNSDVD